MDRFGTMEVRDDGTSDAGVDWFSLTPSQIYQFGTCLFSFLSTFKSSNKTQGILVIYNNKEAKSNDVDKIWMKK